MKGLIIKDLTVLKSSLKTVLIIVVLFAFMGIKSGSAYMTTFASVYAAILPMTCMAYDERSRFNRYAVAMPISPRDIALSKYLTGLILAAVATAIALVITLFTKAPIGETAAGCMLIPAFYHTFMLPVMFKFGVEKSRLMVLIGVVIPAVGISFMEEAGILDTALQKLSTTDEAVVMAVVFAVMAVLYLLSIGLSVSICKNKEW
ncbi:MAG: ABC-2 transporter permease [Oscillospiraceae bacterium]|nr:ABC-2 transporter permease [Oscillospiraceae bacterium]